MSCHDHPDLYIRQGDDVTFSVSVVDSSAVPYDLGTVLDISCVLKGSFGLFDVTISKHLGHGITVQAPSTLGVFDVALDVADTTSMKAGTRYGLECKMKLADSTIVTVFEGSAEVQGQLVAVLT
jgi:hypothetical protein